ncbi:MAG TPA: glycosyl transferase [Rhodanobacteraceae bacterium]|nr:glycosyl transferase [Rhodanobacteraceae bacterium]
MSPHSYSRTEFLRSLWPWLPLWTLLALLAIFAHGPMPLYSTRTLAVAWEMWQGGHWIVPYLNGEPYSHKVPLLFWLIHAGWFAFGVNDIWPRLLEVAFGAIELVLASMLARRLFPRSPWIAKATPWMLLALGYGFLFGLQIMYEVLLAVCVLAALLCLTPKPTRAAPRFALFAFCIGLGLLTKGPVMLLHVLFPWLLGPLWNAWARDHRGRWYGFGLLALLGGFAMLVAWAWPAIHLGGVDYANELLFKQTGGRVVDAFDHARPLWWYLPYLPVLLFPFSLWPRAWVALAALRRPWSDGVRFALAWLLPTLLVFSLISGKQLYYPLPEFAGACLLLAAALARLRERRPALAQNPWLGPWPAALAAFAAGLGLLASPWLIEASGTDNHWFIDLARHGQYFGVIFLLLGALVLLRGRGELRRLAIAGLIGAFAGNALFTLSQWQKYDLRPVSQLLAAADAGDQPIANLAGYAGQFQFLARLTHPVTELTPAALADWARAHPDGLVIAYPRQLSADDLRYAILVEPFRSDWLVAWRAPVLAALKAGRTPDEPAQATLLYPENDWRYRKTN